MDEAVDYSTLTKTQLQEEIDRRNADQERDPELRLARTGNNPELIERLIADDARLAGGDEDLLDDGDPDLESEPDIAKQAADALIAATEGALTPDQAASAAAHLTMADPTPPRAPEHGRAFEARYAFSGGELGTSLHLEFLQRIVADAQAQGLPVKGGAYRERFEDEGGQRFAVYRVHLRRG